MNLYILGITESEKNIIGILRGENLYMIKILGLYQLLDQTRQPKVYFCVSEHNIKTLRDTEMKFYKWPLSRIRIADLYQILDQIRQPKDYSCVCEHNIKTLRDTEMKFNKWPLYRIRIVDLYQIRQQEVSICSPVYICVSEHNNSNTTI